MGSNISTPSSSGTEQPSSRRSVASVAQCDVPPLSSPRGIHDDANDDTSQTETSSLLPSTATSSESSTPNDIEDSMKRVLSISSSKQREPSSSSRKRNRPHKKSMESKTNRRSNKGSIKRLAGRAKGTNKKPSRGNRKVLQRPSIADKVSNDQDARLDDLQRKNPPRRSSTSNVKSNTKARDQVSSKNVPKQPSERLLGETAGRNNREDCEITAANIHSKHNSATTSGHGFVPNGMGGVHEVLERHARYKKAESSKRDDQSKRLQPARSNVKNSSNMSVKVECSEDSSVSEGSQVSDISYPTRSGLCCFKGTGIDGRDDQGLVAGAAATQTRVPAPAQPIMWEPVIPDGRIQRIGPHFTNPQPFRASWSYPAIPRQPVAHGSAFRNLRSHEEVSIIPNQFGSCHGVPQPHLDSMRHFFSGYEPTNFDTVGVPYEVVNHGEPVVSGGDRVAWQSDPHRYERSASFSRNSKHFANPRLNGPGYRCSTQFPTLHIPERRGVADRNNHALSSRRNGRYVPYQDKQGRNAKQGVQNPAPQSRPTGSHRRQSHVYEICGLKVTMVDFDRKIFVIDMVPRNVCRLIRCLLNQHIENVKGDEEKSWRTLYTYTKMDLPCMEVTSIKDIINQIMATTKHVVGAVYGKTKEAMKLQPRSWKEPHVLLYQRLKGKPEHTGVEMHYDGCHITWQLMLTDLDEYQGGGTYFRCLKKTIKLKQGQVLCHPGELYHKGVDITLGTRLLVVAFTDGFDPEISDDSQAEDYDESDEANVVVC